MVHSNLSLLYTQTNHILKGLMGKLTRTSLDLPTDVKRRLKVASAELGKTQKDVLTELINEFLASVDRKKENRAKRARAAERKRAKEQAAIRDEEERAAIRRAKIEADDGIPYVAGDFNTWVEFPKAASQEEAEHG